MKKILSLLLLVATIICCASCSSPPPDEQDEKECAVGESIIVENLKVTLKSVNSYVDSNEWVMDVPDEGKCFVVLCFEVENIGDKDEHFNMLYEDSYCDDESIDTTLLFNYDSDEIWGDIAKGKKRVGHIAYEVKEDWSKIEFIYKPNIFDENEKYTFIANKSDIK